MATIKLVVRHEYHHEPRNLHYMAGQVIDADAVLGAWLCADAPDNFAPFVEPPTKTLDAPQVDKQVKRAPRKKGL